MAVDIHSLRDSHGRGLTVGVIHENGALRTRLEIDEFVKKKDIFNLYLLALIDLQKYDTWKDRFSYFQIAGIHGKPYVPWDNVPPNDRANPMSGYCSHGSNLFPTWHRAYLALLEQTIFLEMVKIAENYPEPYRRRYLDAVVQFGLPYWDPFLPRRRVMNQYGYPIFKCGVPIIMMILRVCVRTPKQPGVLTEVENPLYAYDFHMERMAWEKDVHFTWEDMFKDVLQAPTMAFHTIRGLSPNGSTDHTYLNNTLTNAVSRTNGDAVPLGGKIYRLLNGPPMSYTQMSNSAYVHQGIGDKERPLNKENSLEGFHNDIHVLCGTGEGGRLGHMALNEFAAFDPIFFLHHANIDRICAIWQAMNDSDEVWNWNQPLLEGASYVTPVGQPETPRTPLIPFRKVYKEFIQHELIHHDAIIQEQIPQDADHQKETHHTGAHHKKKHHNHGHHKTIHHENAPPEEVYIQEAYDEDIPHAEYETIWWTSNDLRHCRQLGYTYPELVQTNSDVQLLRQWVIENYEWTTICGEPPPLKTIFSTEDLEFVEAFPHCLQIDGRGPELEVPKERPIYGKEVGSKSSIPQLLGNCFIRSERTPTQKRYGHLKGLINDERLTHWNITVKVEKFALGGSFTIFFFLGDFPSDPRTWHHHQNLVGIDGIFATRAVNMGNCENCRQQNDSGLVDSDVIPLTTPLISCWKNKKMMGGCRLKCLDIPEVLQFLKRNLHWRVLDANGRERDRREIPSLQVDIGSQVVRLPYDFGRMPDYEAEIIHHNVTTGQ